MVTVNSGIEKYAGIKKNVAWELHSKLICFRSKKIIERMLGEAKK